MVSQFVDVAKYMRPGEKLEDLMSRCLDVRQLSLSSFSSVAVCFSTLLIIYAFLRFVFVRVQEGVLVAPGYISGREYTHHIRVCFTAVPPDDLREALIRLQRALGIV